MTLLRVSNKTMVLVLDALRTSLENAVSNDQYQKDAGVWAHEVQTALDLLSRECSKKFQTESLRVDKMSLEALKQIRDTWYGMAAYLKENEMDLLAEDVVSLAIHEGLPVDQAIDRLNDRIGGGRNLFSYVESLVAGARAEGR